MQVELCRVDFLNNYLTDYGKIKTTKLIFLKKEKKPQLGHAGSSGCGGFALSFLLKQFFWNSSSDSINLLDRY
jgi:hypothetical protein